MVENGPESGAKTAVGKQLHNLARFLSAWCDAVGVQPADLAERVKEQWAARGRLSDADSKRFGSSRPHFYRLLKGEVHVDGSDRDMLEYLSEIFEIDVAQLFDNLADRVWPTVHLSPADYVEAPLQDAAAKGARYLFPPEHLAGCPMHHLYLELDGGGTSGVHRHFAGTEMMRLDEGDGITIRFPTRASNRQQITLRQGEVAFFDATLVHQVINDSNAKVRIFINRNYDFDAGPLGDEDGQV